MEELRKLYESDAAISQDQVHAQVQILIKDKGEGHQLLAQFIKENIDVPQDPRYRPEVAKNSLRYHIIRLFRGYRSPVAEEVMGHIIRTSPVLKEVLEATLTLEEWGITTYLAQSREALPKLAAETMANLPERWDDRSPLLCQAAGARVMYGDGNVPPGFWDELENLTFSKISWASMFQILPADAQVRLLREIAGRDHLLYMCDPARSQNLERQEIVDASVYLFHKVFGPDNRLRVLGYHNGNSMYRSVRSAEGSAGSIGKRVYQSEEERDLFLRQAAGKLRMFQRYGEVELNPTQKMLLEKRLEELSALVAEAPNWPIKGQEPVAAAAGPAPRTDTPKPGEKSVEARRFEEMIVQIENGEAIKRQELEAWLRPLRQGDSAWHGFILDFLKRNVDLQVEFTETDPGNERSLRWILLEGMTGYRASPQMVEGLVYVVETSPSLREVLEASLYLRQVERGKHLAKIQPALASLSKEALASLPVDPMERAGKLAVIGGADMHFGSGELLPRVWTEFAALPEIGSTPLGGLFLVLPGEQQDRILEQAGLENPGIAAIAQSGWMGGWDFGHERTRELAFRAFMQYPPDTHDRARFLGSQNMAKPRRSPRVDARGVASLDTRTYYTSEEERSIFLRKLDGAEQLLIRIQGAATLSAAQEEKLQQALTEIRAARQNAPEDKIRN